MATVLKPLADRVIVKQFLAEEKSAGGIILTGDAKEAPNRGTVIKVGTGTKDDPMVTKEGDIAIFGKYVGTQIEFEGTEYLILKQSDILAVIEQTEEPTN